MDTTNPIEYEGFALADHPSDVITFAVDGLGTVDVYNCANFVSYKSEAVTQTVEVVLVLLEHPYRLALTFHDVRHISSATDPGPLSEPRDLEFVRFVFGKSTSLPALGTSSLRPTSCHSAMTASTSSGAYSRSAYVMHKPRPLVCDGESEHAQPVRLPRLAQRSLP